MKVILLTVLVLTGAANTVNAQKLWAENDRHNLISGLSTTKDHLVEEVIELNAAQWNFKPDQDSWSIAEVVEHIGVYEEYLYWDLYYGQYTPERPDLAEKVKGNDSQFLAYATDQAKGQSPWIALPIGRFQSPEALLDFFNRFRQEVMAYIKTTESDLRLHFTYRAPGSGIWTERDLHQHTLIWIAHTTRHTNQIKRIKSDPNFPKK